MRIYHFQLIAIFVVTTGLIAGCTGGVTLAPHPIQTGGDARLGRQIVVSRHCGTCHTIPGVRGANGVFGPPLNAFSRRTVIAGNFPNTPEALVPWIVSPTSMKPKTAMPDLGLSAQQARDVAAYLYTLH